MDIYGIITVYLESGKNGVLATVVKTTGSTPRGVGTKMFVGEDGKTFGTIGGGRVEAEAHKEALALLDKGGIKILSLYTETQRTEKRDMSCGGDLEILLEPVTARHLDVYREIERFRKNREKGFVITRFRDNILSKTLINTDLRDVGDRQGPEIVQLFEDFIHEKKPTVKDGILIDPLRVIFPLYLFGAGHVSQSVARVAKIVDFEVTVIDDREEFANRERFPDADIIIVWDFHETLSCLEFTGNEFVVIVTRSHESDAAVLRWAVRQSARYIGMIGSTMKVKTILGHMREDGFDEKILEKIHAPIGISIDAETPQEIAISIVAELIRVRAKL
ncbi:MAG: hypothetical protein C0392_13360 [Syntrophus sp. (in: bacteria)]|nr:hypothetical protein [Syntrophus sp. (in: bacteria)]